MKNQNLIFRHIFYEYAQLNPDKDFIEELVKYLSFDKINIHDEQGRTALILASVNNHNKVVEMLLNIPNIDVNIQDNTGNMALIWVSTKDHDEIVECY